MPGITTGSQLLFKDPRVGAPVWHHIDAKGHVVGRLAAKVAKLLQGKHKPVYDPAVDCGDYVVITNAKHVMFTGRKWQQKFYKWHTGYPGGLKSMQAKLMREKHPEKIIQKAVFGMIPKNKLKKFREEKLKVFAEGEHHYKVELASQPKSAIAVNIGPNHRWLKRPEITPIEQYLVGGYDIKTVKGLNGEPTVVKIPQRGFLDRSASFRRLLKKDEVGELNIDPRPLAPPPQYEEITGLEDPIGDTTKPLPIGYGAKIFEVKPIIKRWAWPTDPMSEDAVLAREMTPEEIAKQDAQKQRYKEEQEQDIRFRLEEWDLEHNYRYKTFDWEKRIFYTDLVKDPKLRAKLAAEAAKRTTTISDPRIAELIKKKETAMITRAEEYWTKMDQFIAKGGKPARMPIPTTPAPEAAKPGAKK